MSKSHNDDKLYGDLQVRWGYRADGNDQRAPGTAAVSDDLFTNHNQLPTNDVYLGKHPFDVADERGPARDDAATFSALPSVTRVNNLQNYGALNLGNGQLVQVYYDESHDQFMIPVSGQYERFGGAGHAESSATPPTSHMFSGQEYTSPNTGKPAQTTPLQNCNFVNDPLNSQNSNMPTSSFLKEVLGNWAPNSSGTYSPFGQNYPLNHPDAPAMNTHQNNSPILDAINVNKQEITTPKRNENSPLADTSNKKRIVAEVKPMRPSYSDVLAKNTKNNIQVEPTRKVKPSAIVEPKVASKVSGQKAEKQSSSNVKVVEEKHKNEKKIQSNTVSSGSESGDITIEDNEKPSKPPKKNRNKRNMSRKWSSLDNVSNEDDSNYNESNNNSSQFVFIESHPQKKKDKKSHDNKSKQSRKSPTIEEYSNFDDDDDDDDDDDQSSQFLYQEGHPEGIRSKKKKETRIFSHKPGKSNQDKKKNQSKWKRNKPGYLGLAQNYLEHWGGATWKAVFWFLYLLSDIFRMSAHLSFDLCTSMFTQTYVSSQAVWRSSKDWMYKLKDSKYLLYIDRKLGHTRLGFWRRLKWLRKESDMDNGGDANRLNANIPLPATGEEAMKRLLACKGKDPYSILGVSETCSDEEIKRYYRRQAFLVHPDKNQQPGAEEAFKILQHAFELIGEPERREAYERRAQESRHVEAAWGDISQLLAQLHDKMEVAANTIRCTNCGRRHKRVATDRPCYAARYCSQCKIRHSAKEGDIWAESSMMGLLVMYYACMDGAVYQITQWASCQKRNLKQLRPDCHVVQYRIVLGNKAAAAPDVNQRPAAGAHDPNLEEFLNNLYNKSGSSPNGTNAKQPTTEPDAKLKRRNKKTKI